MRSLDGHSPLSAFIYFMSVIGLCMFCRDLVISSISLLFSVLYYFVYGAGRGVGFHIFAAVFFALMVAINPFFYHGGSTVLFVLGDNPVTLEAVIYGVSASEMAVSVLYWFRAFTRIMTEDKLLSLAGRFSPKFSLMLSMVVRFVPLFARRSKKVNDAQRVLGAYKEDNVVDAVRCGARVFSGTAGWALENGITTADSMAARGYGTGRRTSFSLYRSRAHDYVLIALTLVLLAGAVVGAAAGEKFSFYPEIVVPGGAFAILLYTFYTALCATSTILEISERARWKYLKSKI